MSKLNLDAAIAASIRRDALASADENARWVIRKRKTIRIPARSELEKRVRGSQTCFHDLPYTLACKKCKRSEDDARRERDTLFNLIKALKSIT
jgi:hypothetical protein